MSEPKKFDPPAAHPAWLGMPVYWYEAGAGTPHAALVSRLDMGTAVTLNIVSPDTHNFIIRGGVKHKDDPTLRDDEKLENGVWEPVPERRPAPPPAPAARPPEPAKK